MSTVTIISQKSKHKREHSFKKQPVHPQYIQSQYGQQQQQHMPAMNPSSSTHHSSSVRFNLPNDNNHYNKHQNGNRIPGPPQNMTSPRSALTAQIQPQKQHLANQSSGQPLVIQSRNPDGKLVVKQMPYSKKTHV